MLVIIVLLHRVSNYCSDNEYKMSRGIIYFYILKYLDK